MRRERRHTWLLVEKGGKARVLDEKHVDEWQGREEAGGRHAEREAHQTLDECRTHVLGQVAGAEEELALLEELLTVCHKEDLRRQECVELVVEARVVPKSKQSSAWYSHTQHQPEVGEHTGCAA